VHEVALAQGILDVVLDLAGDQAVRTIRVRAGELQAVTEESLRFCFEMVAQGTNAANAHLEVSILPGDTLLVDGIELEDGWRFRPDLELSPEVSPEHQQEHARERSTNLQQHGAEHAIDGSRSEHIHARGRDFLAGEQHVALRARSTRHSSTRAVRRGQRLMHRCSPHGTRTESWPCV
jgi:Zn finger protein HypA/HybF involved in hydrogenase expression